MSASDKEKFDSLNDTSYLFRIGLNRLGFDIQPFSVANDIVWHVYYENTVVGSITFRTDENGYSYCNLRLYKYFSHKFPKLKDFIMSDYYEFSEGKRNKFMFDKFDKYFEKIKTCILSLKPGKDIESKPDDLNDSISRLTEYCEEYDTQFSNNVMFRDIQNILNENERLNKEIKKYSESILSIFEKC